MPEISYKDVVKTLEAEVGYQGQRYNSKFTEFLDSVNWYNYKKAGATTWCCILADYAIVSGCSWQHLADQCRIVYKTIISSII